VKAKSLRCPNCGGPARLTDSAEVYHGRSYGPAYVCVKYPACDSYVGCHPNTEVPLGTLAGPELRRARNAAHRAFDGWWRGGGLRRSDAYRMLAERMGMTRKQAHIALMSEGECWRVTRLFAGEQSRSIMAPNPYETTLPYQATVDGHWMAVCNASWLYRALAGALEEVPPETYRHLHITCGRTSGETLMEVLPT
jgi:hypothetical protein